MTRAWTSGSLYLTLHIFLKAVGSVICSLQASPPQAAHVLWWVYPAVVGVIQFYDVDTKIWRQEEFICDIFSPKDLRGKAVAVGGNLLYWYAVGKQCLVGYDVTTKMWFVGYVPMHDLSNYWVSEERRVDAPPSLAHLGGDMFCLFWISRIVPQPPVRRATFFPGYTNRIHCVKIRVTPPTCPGDRGIIPLEPTIMSCQSYIVHGTKAFCDELVV